MYRKTGLVLVLVIAIFAILTPSALAQGADGDRLVIGQAFRLPAGEELNGNLVVFGGSAILEPGSVVRGDVAVFGGMAGEYRWYGSGQCGRLRWSVGSPR